MTRKFVTLLFFVSITSLFLISPVFAIANPASTYCVEQGYKLEIRTDPSSGGQYGVCIFPDGKECEEWKFFIFREECGVEYKKELPCKKAGEEIKTGQCCEGLTAIKNDTPGPYEGCTGRVGGWAICSDCGNKICENENWENTCNCPSDCTTIKQIDYNTVYYISGIVGLIVLIFIIYFLLSRRRKK